jgi:hypothetical protein
LHTARDISEVDQLGKIRRYYSIERGKNGDPEALSLNESSTGFYEDEDNTTAVLAPFAERCRARTAHFKLPLSSR